MESRKWQGKTDVTRGLDNTTACARTIALHADGSHRQQRDRKVGEGASFEPGRRQRLVDRGFLCCVE
jgi:hypothetical protein